MYTITYVPNTEQALELFVSKLLSDQTLLQHCPFYFLTMVDSYWRVANRILQWHFLGWSFIQKIQEKMAAIDDVFSPLNCSQKSSADKGVRKNLAKVARESFQSPIFLVSRVCLEKKEHYTRVIWYDCTPPNFMDSAR